MKSKRRMTRPCRISQFELLEDRTVLTSPSITSAAIISIPENQTAVVVVAATDPESPPETLTFSISGGADSGRFTINTSTGALTFLAPPDFDVPGDADVNNVYEVEVTVNDGNLGTDTQSLTVTVTGLNDNLPVFTSSGSFNVPENTTVVGTVVATDADLPAQTVTYSITGGADAAKFTLNPNTGELTFQSAPNFEAPTDIGTNNVYDVIVTANDGAGSTKTQNIAVTVTAVNDNAPVITSPATFNVLETSTTVGTVVATDADLPANGNSLTYAISGGLDQLQFSINANTGVLSFLAAPDFETPLDSGANNIYNVDVTVTDAGGTTATQQIAVTVTNIPPLFSSSLTFNVPENTTAVGTVVATDSDTPAIAPTYSISGGADANKFTIDPATGVLTFQASPNFESPSDVGGNNVYNVQVTATLGSSGTSAFQNIAVTVTSQNDNAPVFSSAAAFTVPENTATVGTMVATDADTPAQTLTYSISGGADSDKFNINATTGALVFKAAPNFEMPLDAGVDNVYDLQITASDGQGMSTVKAITVTVTALNDNAPIFTSAATFSVVENHTAVGNMTATDADLPPQTLSYSISGTDAAFFEIDPVTGVLEFKDAPDFEAPDDAGGDNVYNLKVTANDNGGSTTDKDITVTVTNELDAPVINLNPATATYYLHKDKAFVSPTATFVADVSVTSFTDSKLVVSITNNRFFRDSVSIYPKGNRSGQINIEGHRVLYGGEVIGRFHGGRFNQDLEIKFNSSATRAAINQLVKRINFNADSHRSIGSTRTVQMQLLDPTGQVSASATRMINVLAPV